MHVQRGKISGSGEVSRQALARIVVVIDDVVDTVLGVVERGLENAPKVPSEVDGRVVQYDECDSTQTSRHYTTLGRVLRFINSSRVLVECPVGVCREITKNSYRAFWSRDGRLVLIGVNGVSETGEMRALKREEKRPFDDNTLTMSRNFQTRPVAIDVSLNHLGRLGQHYTDAFIDRIVKQLRTSEFPVSHGYAKANPAGDLRAIRAFGHTVRGTALRRVDGRVEVQVEAPVEALDAIGAGRWSLEPIMRMQVQEEVPAVDGSDDPPKRVCRPVLGGLRLYAGAVGMSLDLRAASVILDAPA